MRRIYNIVISISASFGLAFIVNLIRWAIEGEFKDLELPFVSTLMFGLFITSLAVCIYHNLSNRKED